MESFQYKQLEKYLTDNPAETVFDLEEEQTEFDSVILNSAETSKIDYLEFDKRLDPKIIENFKSAVRKTGKFQPALMKKWPFSARHI